MLDEPEEAAASRLKKKMGNLQERLEETEKWSRKREREEERKREEVVFVSNSLRNAIR